MIEVKIDKEECKCNVSGEPAVLAAQLVQLEKTVMETIGKRGLCDLVAFGWIYQAILQTAADNANKEAKCNCAEVHDEYHRGTI